MKKFKIVGFLESEEVLITNSEFISSASTFEESLTLNENMKSNLSFKILDKLSNGEDNFFIKLIFPGAKIRLYLDDDFDNHIFDFIIKSISNEFYQDLISYSVEAEDFASTIYSKEGQGLSLGVDGYFTGTLKEICYEILYSSRKNLGYENLNKNYLTFLKYSNHSNISFASDLSSSVSINATNPVEAYITFPRDRSLEVYDYTLFINILEVPTNGFSIKITQLDANGSFIEEKEYPNVYNKSLLSLDFTPRSAMSYFKITFYSSGFGFISAVDWKLKLKELQFQNLIDGNLKLSPYFIEENFKGELGDISYYKKVTLSLSNSNLYNGLVELAKLFDADLSFDYENEYVNFINKNKEYQFKGFKLSPFFNLNNLSRTEDYSEFLSALNISGNDSVYSIFPSIPSEFKQYFSDCINNNFLNETYFNDYNTMKYIDIAEYVKNNYISDSDDYSARSQLIDNFAIAADKVPNLENRIYSLDYFYKTNKLSAVKYETFNSIINNDLRKLNIKLRIYSDQYLTMSSALLTKESEIDFLCKNITVELINIESIQEQLNKVELYSSNWVTFTNELSASAFQIDLYHEELMKAYNIVFDILTLEPQYLEHIYSEGVFKLTEDSYTNLILNVYGYYNIYKNGIKQKIDEVKETINTLANTRAVNLERIAYLTTQIDDITITSYRKREFEVEKSGLESQVKASRYLIGDYTSDPFDPTLKGQYQNQLYYLNLINNFLGNYLYKSSLINYSTWSAGQDLNYTSYWSSLGDSSVVLEGNKDFATTTQKDIMIRLKKPLVGISSSATTTTLNNLDPSKVYRISTLIKAPAEQFDFIISTDIDDLSICEVAFDSLEEKWFGVEFFINTQDMQPKVYSFPEYVELPINNVNYLAGEISTLANYQITFSINTSNNGDVFIYRPRVDEVTDSMPSIEDIYNLYDNPLMINYEEDFSIDFNQIEGLYDLLYNLNYPGNINKWKNTIINNLYKDYESYLIEGYYENSDEITSEGLLEQALVSFESIKYPKINYDVSVIDLSDLEDYKYLKLNVGDKILIAEKEDRLYKSYQPESTKFLQISDISYNLREMENTKLTVKQDDETTKILQYILKATQ